MRWLKAIITAIREREPAATAALFRTLLYLLMALHAVNIDQTQAAEILLFFEMLLTYWLRGTVIPIAQHKAVVNAALDLPSGASVEMLEDVLKEKKSEE